jgi:flagellar basal body-associated protein FliL
MTLAITPSGASGPAEWIAILVAGIAAVAAIAAAVVAALSARSTKQLELRAQRTRELESRISERKIDVYKPLIELLGNVISNAAQRLANYTGGKYPKYSRIYDLDNYLWV